jgi:acetoin utilization protein AcuB
LRAPRAVFPWFRGAALGIVVAPRCGEEHPVTPARQTEPTLRELMTPVPHTVTADSSVAEARSRMQALGIRHLPVMHEGRLVGMLGEQTLVALCEHGSADPHALAVGDVLDGEAWVLVGPEMSVATVLQSMMECRADCAAVVENGELTGILTAQDLVPVLAKVLFTGAPRPSQPPRPSAVRTRILAEHTVLRALYAAVDQHARAVLAGEAGATAALRDRGRELCTTLLRHIELENTVLAPALHDLDAFGPVRAQQLIAEHERQRSVLASMLVAIDEGRDRELADDMLRLISELRIDMAHEEESLLHSGLLRDDLVAPDSEAG